MLGFQQSDRPTLWCGALAACGTLWRHGCRHGAYRDVLAACPASGKGAALSTHQAFDCIRKDDDILRSAVQCGRKIQWMLQSLSDRAAPWLQGPCPPTIAGRAVNPSMEALMRHPCRIRSRDGGRARTGREGRRACFSTKQPANSPEWCPYRLRDPVAAWMPPRSLQGRTCGVSRERQGRRTLDELQVARMSQRSHPTPDVLNVSYALKASGQTTNKPFRQLLSAKRLQPNERAVLITLMPSKRAVDEPCDTAETWLG